MSCVPTGKSERLGTGTGTKQTLLAWLTQVKASRAEFHLRVKTWRFFVLANTSGSLLLQEPTAERSCSDLPRYEGNGEKELIRECVAA